MKEIQRKKQLNFQEIILKLCATDLKLGLFWDLDFGKLCQTTLEVLKNLKIKLSNPENCPCKLCKRFLPQVGFL